MPPDSVIRPAEQSDDLTALWRAVYDAQHAPLLPAGTRVAFEGLGRAYVATVADTVTGFCCVEGDWLHELWVAVDWQRRGVGSALLNHAESLMRSAGYSMATLNVLAINEAAIRFYERHGWQRESQSLPSVTGMTFYRYRKRL